MYNKLMDVLSELRKFVDEKPSHTAAAKALEISDAYLSRLLSGERPVTEQIARKFGYSKRIMFVKG